VDGGYVGLQRALPGSEKVAKVTGKSDSVVLNLYVKLEICLIVRDIITLHAGTREGFQGMPRILVFL